MSDDVYFSVNGQTVIATDLEDGGEFVNTILEYDQSKS